MGLLTKTASSKSLHTKIKKLVNKHYQEILIDGESFIDFRESTDSTLKTIITNALSNELDWESVAGFYNRYPVSFLAAHWSILAQYTEWSKKQPVAVRQFFDRIKEINAARAELFAKRMKLGTVEMNDLDQLFTVGSEIVMFDGETLVAGELQSISVEWSFFGPKIDVSLSVIHGLNGLPSVGAWNGTIRGFKGLAKIDELPIRIITNEEKIELSKRGKIANDLCKPGAYASYTGELQQPSFWHSRTYRADGRIVIDPTSFAKMDPERWQDVLNTSGISAREIKSIGKTRQKTSNVLTEVNYWQFLPYLYGFSMAVKQWGRLSIEGVRPVEFRTDAFEKLVLPAEDKKLIFSLVKHHGKSVTDFIEGKGGGCIFLLHGDPGWGKTATAEAVAEVLKKPLYAVSIGELGTNIVNLEKSLRGILDIVTSWDAVVLLDEADIFLEARDEKDIQRNAMVGVFLRLLEYHNGVLFLTTNRVKDIDRAFYSRISVAMHYKPGNLETRAKIWTNLLSLAKLNVDFAQTMAHYTINGRQIKNTIRLAQTLAIAEDRVVELSDLERCVKSALQFQADMQFKDEASEPEAKAATNGGTV